MAPAQRGGIDMTAVTSLRIAVAVAATIGTGMLTPTGAEARSDKIVFQSDDSPGALAAKERRFYSAFNQTKDDRKASKRRAKKPHDPALPPPAIVTRENSSTELRFGAFPFDPMIPQR
jgi:hypothetical protein